MSFVPSIVALSTMAAVALWIAVVRGGIGSQAVEVPSAVRRAILAVLGQTAHFLEEASTGFNLRFPGLFDLDPMSIDSFVAINVVALVLWVLSIVALIGRSSIALFPLWFLAVASVCNAVFHPALALVAGGYFPGVLTSPIVGVTGVLLLGGLARITRPGVASTASGGGR